MSTPRGSPPSATPHSQRGAALLISLILLLVMSLIGVTAMQSATLQERMAGNTRDRHLAFQAAEAALREAETFLDAPSLPEFTNVAGLYLANAPGRPVWHGPSPLEGNGALTYAGNLGPALARPPQYFIEALPGLLTPGCETEVPPTPGGPCDQTFFRITARGFGGSDTAVVVLSTVYRRD